jgi:RNA polymerase sigma-70 factor (ECF subfamily)
VNLSPATRHSLLIRIRDARDDVAWQEFVRIYAPLIHAYCMRRGLQDADAADVAQQVLQSVARAMPGFNYNPAQGSFRSWLFTVTRNQLMKSLEKLKRIPQASGDTSVHEALAQQPDATDEETVWNLEHQRRLFDWAASKTRGDFRESTWLAFWRVAVEGKSAAEVAGELGMSVGAVYIAKSRVTAAIRQRVELAEQL